MYFCLPHAVLEGGTGVADGCAALPTCFGKSLLGGPVPSALQVFSAASCMQLPGLALKKRGAESADCPMWGWPHASTIPCLASISIPTISGKMGQNCHLGSGSGQTPGQGLVRRRGLPPHQHLSEREALGRIRGAWFSHLTSLGKSSSWPGPLWPSGQWHLTAHFSATLCSFPLPLLISESSTIKSQMTRELNNNWG